MESKLMFKKKKDLSDHIILKDYPKKLVRYALTINDGAKDIDFYEFASSHDMPVKRYAKFLEYNEDYQRGISRVDLTKNLSELEKELTSNTIDGVTGALIRVKWLKSRQEISNDVDLIMDILSCALFTFDENLTDYDYEIGEWKKKLFEKEGVPAFFLSVPISKYWKSTNITSGDIKVMLSQRKGKRIAIKRLNKMGIFTLGESLESRKVIDST
jgi:hypothetical protein